MAKSDFDVGYVAALARLRLTPEESATFQAQLGDVLRYAAKIADVDVSGVEAAAAHAVPVFNVVREDEARDWFTAEEALRHAPRQANDLFVVPKVIE